MGTLTWFKSMQMARDLGHSLADATNSLGSHLVTKRTGQSSAVTTADLQTSQPNTNPNTNTNTNTNTNINTSTNNTVIQTPKPKQAANNTAAATAQPEQTSRQLYDSQVHLLQTPFLYMAISSCSSALREAPCSQTLPEQRLLCYSAQPTDSHARRVPARYISLAKQVQITITQALTVCIHAQVDQLADMVSAVFMVHSASQLDVFDHLNTSHAITAAELAVDLFWKQVSLLPLHVSSCHIQ